MRNPIADIPAALARFGPGSPREAVDEATARAWCVGLTRARRENFAVLSRFVPPGLRDDFAAVYAFCRWADDLGDELGSTDASLEALAWWRDELGACFAGEPRHPVFVALAPTVRRHALPIEPFGDLISAFELDQRKDRYATWDELVGYCRLSADPVGRIVLMLLGEGRDAATFAASDATCTGLQLANHWQDLRRDLLERNRIYVPAELNAIPDFEDRFLRTARQGFACDRTFLAESRRLVRSLVDRTWPLFERGESLLPRVSPASRPIVWLFLHGGAATLREIELWNCESVLHRPRVPAWTRASLLARAWWGKRFGGLLPEGKAA
jgi:squalene synthase HpnC